MTLRHIEVFCMVCREGTMSAAAKRIHITQPAVSRMISELEHHYNVQLFERINKQIYLTNQGHQLWEDSENLMLAYEKLEEHIKGPILSSSLRIGCGVGIGTSLMHNFVKCFSARYPDCKVYISENSSRIIQQQVAKNELDFALIEGEIAETNLHNESFYTDRLIPVCSPQYIDQITKKPITFADLADENLMLPERGFGTRELVEREAMKNNVVLHPIWSSASHLNILNRTISGEGISILSRLIVRDALQSKQVVEIPADFKFDRVFSIVWHKHKHLTAEAAYFISICHEAPADTTFDKFSDVAAPGSDTKKSG